MYLNIKCQLTLHKVVQQQIKGGYVNFIPSFSAVDQ